jgi:hypothetical protein
MKMQTGFTIQSSNSTSSSRLLMPRKDAIVKPGKEAKNSPFSSKTSHLPEKEALIYRGIYPPTPVALAQRSPSLPESRPRKSPVWEGDPGRCAGDPGTGGGLGAQAPILGLQPPQMSCLLGCYCYAAAEPSGRASQAAGGRLHGATWPREDRRVYLDTPVSILSAAQARAVGFFDSGGLFCLDDYDFLAMKLIRA